MDEPFLVIPRACLTAAPAVEDRAGRRTLTVRATVMDGRGPGFRVSSTFWAAHDIDAILSEDLRVGDMVALCGRPRLLDGWCSLDRARLSRAITGPKNDDGFTPLG